jgi:hypothetical protein
MTVRHVAGWTRTRSRDVVVAREDILPLIARMD